MEKKVIGKHLIEKTQKRAGRENKFEVNVTV